MKKSAPEHFNAIAGRYAASEVHAASPTIQRLHELLGPGQLDTVCEIACGPGYLALSFAGRAKRFIGVDAAPNMLRQFEKLAGDRGLKVEAVQALAEKLPLPSNSIDVVVTRLAPHHFSDPTKALQEMARAAKPGGRVAVIDLEGYEDPKLDDLNHELEVLHDPSHVRSYSASRWRDFFDAAGLVIGTFESGHTEMPGGLAVSRWCEIGNTPQASQKMIRAKVAAATAEQISGLGIRFQNDEIYIPVRTLVVVARKD